MFQAAFLPIIRSSEPYIGFDTLYAEIIPVSKSYLLELFQLRTPDDGQKGCLKHVQSSYQ
jgi:hypothetical protein